MLIVAHYELDDDVAEALCLRYATHVWGDLNRRTVALRNEETLQWKSITLHDGTQCPLTVDDLNIYCYYPQGSIIEDIIACNSWFMLEMMPTIRAEILQKMPWVDCDQPIYPILDNTGGHGTRKEIDGYTKQLREQHNVILRFQPPHSPELNALDLGIWMSLQSFVKCRHRNRRRDAEALARTGKHMITYLLRWSQKYLIIFPLFGN